MAGVRSCKEKLEGFLPAEAADSVEMIITSVESAKNAEFRMFFDPTLVRGMSYYTGTIFEISMDEFGGSVGGGGRYDKMIGKVYRVRIHRHADSPSDLNVLSCCFWKMDMKFRPVKEKKAYLIEKKMPQEGI